MVVLTMTPHRGNSARTFPSTGFLGLSPVSIAGTVQTKLEEDARPLLASSIVVRVRCYETTDSFSASNAAAGSQPQPIGSVNSGARHAMSDSCHELHPCYNTASSSASSSSSSSPSLASSSIHHPSRPSAELYSRHAHSKGVVLWETSTTVWQASPQDTSAASAGGALRPRRRESAAALEYLGDFTSQWRLVIPTEAVHQGAKSAMTFKNWRVWWAVEAIVFHTPSGLHGDRLIRSQQLGLRIYSAPSVPAGTPSWTSDPHANKGLQYSIQTSASALGSGDDFTISYKLQSHNPTDAPRRITVELRREVTWLSHVETTSPRTSPPQMSLGYRLSPKLLQKRSRSHSVKRKAERAISPSAVSSGRNSPQLDNHRISSFTSQHHTPLRIGALASPSYSGLFESDLCKSAGHSAYLAPPALKPCVDDVSLATFESDLRMTSDGTYRGEIHATVPKSKSTYHYALGETCVTPSATARFYLVLKVCLRQKGHFLPLPPKDICITSVSLEERRRACYELPRVLAIQGAEKRLIEPYLADSAMDNKDAIDTPEMDSDFTKLRSVRRRSEQLEAIDIPRTRPRFGSDPNSDILSPIHASPQISMTSSNGTCRVRSAHRRPQSSTHSYRSSRAHIGGACRSSASIRSGSIRSVQSQTSSRLSSFADMSVTSSITTPANEWPARSPALGHSTPLFRDVDKDENSPVLPPAAEGFFANFAGFTLQPPPDCASSPFTFGDDCIGPKMTHGDLPQHGASPSYTPLREAGPFGRDSSLDVDEARLHMQRSISAKSIGTQSHSHKPILTIRRKSSATATLSAFFRRSSRT